MGDKTEPMDDVEVKEDEGYDDNYIGVDENENEPYEGEPGVDEEDEEDIDDDSTIDDDDLIRDIAENPLIDRVQVVLHKQLERAHDRVDLELRSAEEEVKRAENKRETLGVSLYGIQQQLGALQLKLEDTHSKHQSISKQRVKADKLAEKNRLELEDKLVEVKIEKDKLQKNKAEMAMLLSTIKQVEAYNEEMKGEIAVTRRATYKAEEDVTTLEKKKEGQDLYIDELNEQIKQMEDQIALYQAQLISQKQETKTACDILQEASKDMGSIEVERRQLMQDWKSALIGMERRNNALAATKDVIREQQEKEITIKKEIDGYKSNCYECQNKNEILVDMKVRLEHSNKVIDEQLSAIKNEQSKLMDKYEMLKKSLEQTDKEVADHTIEGNQHEEELKIVLKNIEVVDRKRRTLEDDVLAEKNEQTTSNKATKNLARASQLIASKIHDIEIDQSNIENELARIQVDCLNTKARDEELGKQLSKVNNELNSKNKLIEKYQIEIRQRNDEVEKKMFIVTRLNRKYNQLTSGVEEESLGPLEATIHSLLKSTNATNTQNRELERKWLKHQTELVNVVNVMENESTQVHDLKNREVIIIQKRNRLDKQILQFQNELKDLKGGIRAMHNDMAQLNVLLSSNKDKQSELSNSNYVMETNFIEELKELEKASIVMDERVEQAKAEKNQLLEDILESERQLKLWEKKIQLERETIKALDPEVGQAESKEMEKDIHRMRIRYEAMHNEQERMIREMELAVEKREDIATRNMRKHKRGAPEVLTKDKLRKKLMQQKKLLQSKTAEANQCVEAIKCKLDESENLGMELEKASNRNAKLEEQAGALQKQINNSLYDKQRFLDLTMKQQKLLQKYKEFNSHRDINSVAEIDAEAVNSDMAHAEAQRAKIIDVIDQLKAQQPHLTEVLERVFNLTEL